MVLPTTMPTIASSFVRKLYSILNRDYPGIICWNDVGTAFSVFDMELLEQRVLPLYFRGRLDAFRQQLREHGFERVMTSCRVAPSAVESYRHVYFLRGNPNVLSSIVRVQLPRRRTRRKNKPVDTVKVEIKVEQPNATFDPLPLLAPPAAATPPAGNGSNPLFEDERFDILQWLELPAVDDLPLSHDDEDGMDRWLGGGESGVVSAAVLDGAEQLTEDQITAVMRLLATPGGDVDELMRESPLAKSPAPPQLSWLDNGYQFSEDMLSSMADLFSPVWT